MLPVESLKRFRGIDYLAVLLLVVSWSLVIALANSVVQELYLVIFITAAFLSFTALLIRRVGAVFLFSLIGFLLAALTNDYAGFAIALLIVGLIFEVAYILIRKEIKNVPLNLIFASGLASASIPWTILLLSKTDNLTVYALNLGLTTFFIGVVGAILAYLVWYEIRNTKLVIKYEYAV